MRNQSSNNLKQIALAAHNFHDAHKHFPFNGSDAAVGDVKYTKAAKAETSTSGSWGFQILPYIATEQEGVFKNADRTTPVQTYLCPGRGRPDVEAGKNGGAWSDYFWNNYLNDAKNAEKADNADSKSSLIRIADGSSNTVMIGHGNINIDQYQSKSDVTLSTSVFNGGTFGTARAGKNGEESPAGVTFQRDSNQAPDLGSWGGPFERGALFAFCDGAVHFIPYTFNDLNAVLTPAGREIIDFEFDQ